jgi:putative hydrolase of the HAD superfamily
VSNVSAVVFDWYGTLASPNEDDFWNRLPQIILDGGGEPVAEAIAEWESYPLEHRAHSASEATYRAWQRQRLERLFDACDVPEPAVARLSSELDATRYSRLFEVFDDVPEVLADLRSRGLVVGLCSNWDWDLERQLVHNDIREMFDFTVVSACIGYRKPHSAVFETVLERAVVPQESVVFVGDSWRDDICGALEFGIAVVHIARSGACEQAEHGQIACVGDLRQLEEIIEL